MNDGRKQDVTSITQRTESFMAAVAALRFAAIRWRLRLPVFHVPDEKANKR
jgi:hypothetical protein